MLNDPTEHDDVSAQNPDVVARLTERLAQVQATAFSPNRGPADKKLGEFECNLIVLSSSSNRNTGT